MKQIETKWSLKNFICGEDSVGLFVEETWEFIKPESIEKMKSYMEQNENYRKVS